MNNNELFLEKYKKLEYIVTKQYNLAKHESAINYLLKQNEFNKYNRELDYCREIRNFLSHEEKLNDNFVITVSKEMINVLDVIIDLLEHPVYAKDLCIKLKHLYYKTLNDYVISSMLAMSHRKFTHIPIIENNRICYIFSKASIFNYILAGNIDNLTSSIKFKDIIEYIDFNEENYLFVKENDKISYIKDKVLFEYHNHEKVSMIFVTTNGKKDGEFIGMLSPIDLLKERG